MKKIDGTKPPPLNFISEHDEEEERLKIPTPNLRALLDPTRLSPEEIAEKLPLAWKEFREAGVKEVSQVWEEKFKGPPCLSVVGEGNELPERGEVPLGLPYCVALGHFRALLRARHPTSYHQRLAEDVLKQETKKEPPGRWVDTLARELLDRLREAAREIKLHEVSRDQLEEPPSEEGILLYDARAARFFEKIGNEGKQLAEELRKKAQALFLAHTENQPHAKHALWSSCWASAKGGKTPFLFAWVLCRALWRDYVKAELAREQTHPPALCAPAVETMTDSFFSSGRKVQLKEDGGELLSARGALLARLSPVPALTLQDIEATQRCFDKLRTLNGHRVLRAQVLTSHRLYLSLAPRFDRIELLGGWAEVAKWAGAREKDRDEIAEIVKAQATTIVKWPNGNWGNLIKLDVHNAQGRRRGLVAMTLSDFLLPNFVSKFLPKDGTLARQRERQLVPIVEFPPFVGRPNEWGSQATFQLLLLALMRERAEELYQMGSVSLPRLELLPLADRAELPRGILDPLLSRWQTDGEDGRAFLERRGQERYTLAKSYKVALSFLSEAGQEIAGGRKGGQLRAQKKRDRVHSPGSKKPRPASKK